MQRHPIKKILGSFDVFKEKFIEASRGRLGSGWTGLVLDGEKLKILTTANADTLVAHGVKPVVNWDFVASQLKPALKHP